MKVKLDNYEKIIRVSTIHDLYSLLEFKEKIKELKRRKIHKIVLRVKEIEPEDSPLLLISFGNFTARHLKEVLGVYKVAGSKGIIFQPKLWAGFMGDEWEEKPEVSERMRRYHHPTKNYFS